FVESVHISDEAQAALAALQVKHHGFTKDNRALFAPCRLVKQLVFCFDPQGFRMRLRGEAGALAHPKPSDRANNLKYALLPALDEFQHGYAPLLAKWFKADVWIAPAVPSPSGRRPADSRAP